jgi:hypothetical protein
MNKNERQAAAFEGMIQEIWETLPVPIDPGTKKPSAYHPPITKIIWLYMDIVDVLGRSPRYKDKNGEVVHWEKLEYAIPRNMFRLWLDNSILSTSSKCWLSFTFYINSRQCSFFDTPTEITEWFFSGRGKSCHWNSSQRSDNKPDHVGVQQDGRVVEARWHDSDGRAHRSGDKPAEIEIPAWGGTGRISWSSKGDEMRKLHPWLTYFSWPGGATPSQHGTWYRNTNSGHIRVWDHEFKDPKLQSPGKMSFAESVQKFIQPELDKLPSYKPHKCILELTQKDLETIESPVKVYLDYLDAQDKT